MKPIAIFRFSPTEGPAYFAQWLERSAIDYRIIAVDRGDAVPAAAEIRDFSGVGMMGGPMSANDPLPWIPRLLDFVRAADDAGVPVIGHCLGGQLLARALGARVARTATPEIGWGEVAVAPAAQAWFGNRDRFTTFQWHYDVFELPTGATRILTNGYNPNQGYAIGRNVGFQCHIEMTRELVDAWCASGADDLDPSRGPAIQSEAAIRSGLDERLADLSSVADDLYAHWAQGLAR